MLIDNIFEIEWKAHRLFQEYNLQGPLIQLLTAEFPIDNTDLLVIQGSFDPPLISHRELIQKAIEKYRNKFPETNFAFLLLFSLSHVEKEIDVHYSSLLGYRVSMVIELLQSSLEEKVPFMVGISNVGRYYELTEGIYRKFPRLKSIYYCVGIDVFSKIFNSRYYEKPLATMLPDIFSSNYFVGGRGEIISIQEFETFISTLKIPSYFMSQISFISLPKELRYESSTRIRRKLSKDPTSKIPSIPENINSFLMKNHLYSKDAEIVIREFIVQIITKFAIKEGFDKNLCLKIIYDLLNEMKSSKEFRNQVIHEFQKKDYQFIQERILKWKN